MGVRAGTRDWYSIFMVSLFPGALCIGILYIWAFEPPCTDRQCTVVHVPAKPAGIEVGPHLGFDGKVSFGAHYNSGHAAYDRSDCWCAAQGLSRYEKWRAQ